MITPLRPTVAVLIALAAACGSKSEPVATASPASRIRTLTAEDPGLAPLVMAAARSLEPSADLARFSGVFINRREVRALTDSVARGTRLVRVESGEGKVMFSCRIGETCSELAAPTRGTMTYSFTAFRTNGEVAYVAGSAQGQATGTQLICISLARSGDRWVALERNTVTSEARCGE